MAVADGEPRFCWGSPKSCVSKWHSADLQSGNQMSSPHLGSLSKQNLQVSLKSDCWLAPESLARTLLSYSQPRRGLPTSLELGHDCGWVAKGTAIASPSISTPK